MIERIYDGLQGEPGRQIGTFLETEYGVELASILPDQLSGTLAAGPLSGYDVGGGADMPFQGTASLHDDLRVQGKLPHHLADQRAFLAYMQRLYSGLPEAPIGRALLRTPDTVARGKRRALETAVAIVSHDSFQSPEHRGFVNEAVATAPGVKSHDDGTRYLTSPHGMHVRLPDNNGGFVQLLSSVIDGQRRTDERRQGLWRSGGLVAGTHFGRQVNRLQGRGLDELQYPDRGLLDGIDEMMQWRGEVGYDFVALGGLHRLSAELKDEVVGRSHELLGPNGLFLVYGLAETALTYTMTSGDVIQSARSVFGEPAHFATYGATAPSIQTVRGAQEAVFIK